MKTPIRIYYDIQTGRPIVLTGNFEDEWLTRYETIEEQIQKLISLSELNRDSFDVVELPFGSNAQDFAECNGYRVNPETKKLEFSYPDPNEPTAPPVYEKPLTEQIADLKAENLATMGAVAEVYEMLLGGM